MPRKARQIIGAAGLLVFIPFYALIAMRLATDLVSDASIVLQTLYFAVAGLLWVIPAGGIIYWMQKP